MVKQGSANTAEPITNLKLQKLCYYAQGFALAKLKTPLFMDDIDRWQHGPVISSLWREYSQFGSNPIPLPESPLDPEIFSSEARQVLDAVIKTYGPLPAWQLRNKTHGESPWIDTPDGATITHQKIRVYFDTLVDNMPIFGEHGMEDAESPSLAFQMAKDAEFMEMTERGLADLAAGQYSSLEDVRVSLGNV